MIQPKTVRTMAAAWAMTLMAMAPAPVCFGAEKTGKWTEAAPSGSPTAVEIRKGDEALTYYEVTAASPLEVMVTGPAKLRFQTRLELTAGAKGKVREKVWTQVDHEKVKKGRISVKPSKDWKGKDGAPVSARKLFTVRVKAGEHTVKFGLSKGSKNTVLVRVVAGPVQVKEKKQEGKASK